MRQGITTRYIGPSYKLGSRIKAIARKRSNMGAEMSLTIDQDSGLGIDHNHCRAAKALAEKLGWSGLWIAGGKPEEDGNMFVCVPDGKYGSMPTDFGYEGTDWFSVESSDV